MEDIKTTASAHHDDAATQLEISAMQHREAAKHVQNGNFEKAHECATLAAEAETVANRHAMEALELHRQHDEQVAERQAELAAEEAARDAKQAAKASA